METRIQNFKADTQVTRRCPARMDKFEVVAKNYSDDYKDLAKEIYKAGLKRGYEKGQNNILQGEWIIGDDGDCYCSRCGVSEVEFVYFNIYNELPDYYGGGNSNFCPNCGAKMRGAKSD